MGKNNSQVKLGGKEAVKVIVALAFRFRKTD